MVTMVTVTPSHPCDPAMYAQNHHVFLIDILEVGRTTRNGDIVPVMLFYPSPGHFTYWWNFIKTTIVIYITVQVEGILSQTIVWIESLVG